MKRTSYILLCVVVTTCALVSAKAHLTIKASVEGWSNWKPTASSRDVVYRYYVSSASEGCSVRLQLRHSLYKAARIAYCVNNNPTMDCKDHAKSIKMEPYEVYSTDVGWNCDNGEPVLHVQISSEKQSP